MSIWSSPAKGSERCRIRSPSLSGKHHVSDDVDSAVSKYPFAEDVFEAAKWRIARDSECGTPVTHTDAHPPRRVVHIRPLRQAVSPGLLVRYYRLSDVAVIDWVRFYPFDDKAAVLPDAFGVA